MCSLGGALEAVGVRPSVCVLQSVCPKHLAAMVTRAGQDGGGVAVARKVLRVEACHLKSECPPEALLEAPGGCTGREVIMGKRRSRCLSLHW